MELSFREVLMNEIDDMVFIVNVENNDFKYEFLNKSAMRSIGINKNIIGLTFGDVLTEERAEFLYKKCREVLLKRVCVTYEDSYKKNRQNWEKYYSQAKLIPIFDESGLCIRIVSIVKDITKEKVANIHSKDMLKKIAESNERYQSLFNHNSDAIVTLDKKGFIINGNHAVETITGFKAVELVGKSFNDLITGDKSLIKKSINTAMNGITISGEHLLKCRNDTIIKISLKLIPLLVEGDVIELFGIFKEAQRKAIS